MSLPSSGQRNLALVSALALVIVVMLLPGCKERTAPSAAPQVPIVQSARVQPAGGTALQLSATIRARVESPLAFQVGGRIVSRHADAGHTVQPGQTLFQLDPVDLEQAVRAAEADLAAAEASARMADADYKRNRTLVAQSFISPQALERSELLLQESTSRRDAAAARLAQAKNAKGHAALKSPAAGILIDVTGEPGQVVSAGQAVAMLAHAGAREVEVSLPAGVPPPARGEALWPDGRKSPVTLREAAPSVEPLGRTRRARYTLTQPPDGLVLGSVISTRFTPDQAVPVNPVWVVPVGALDERGQGPRVWRITDGRIDPVPVRILGIDDRQAQVAGALSADYTVVALGTQLLREGMTVRERGR